MRVLVLLMAMATLGLSASAEASSLPTPMRDAVDQYATAYAAQQGWSYVDRLSNAHGDYKRGHFTLVFGADYPTRVCNAQKRCWNGAPLPWTWNVEARVAKCGPGWYVVSTPLDPHTCQSLRLSW